MEDNASGELVGVCGLKSAVGLNEPFYNYRIGKLVNSCKELNVFSSMETLYLSNDLTGYAELCTLFLHPAYRHGNNGKLLSKSRFLFMAQFPHLFPMHVIAEMRGYLRPDGTSPFWECLGQHFFKMEFSRADALCGLGKKSFIAELMPRHPLYVDCLPQEAQDVIGRVHADTVPARRLLEQEGLHYGGYVDIFDAGPVLQARIADLRALHESRLAIVQTGAVADTVLTSVSMTGAVAPERCLLVANRVLEDFRVIAVNGGAEPPGGQLDHSALMLSDLHQQVVRCQSGDSVRIMSLIPEKRHYG